MQYEHLTALDDAEKPYRRVWRCSSGVCVKTHAVTRDVGFGRLHWTITGAHCDEAGKAMPRGDGHAIHEDAHELVLASEAEMTAEERAAYVREQYDAALLVVVKRVEAAVLNEAAAQRLTAGSATQ